MTARCLAVAVTLVLATGCAARIEKRVKGTGMLVGSWAVPGGYYDLKAQEMSSIHLPLINPQPVAYVDGSGHFAFSNLLPGRYRVTEFWSGGALHWLARPPKSFAAWADNPLGSREFDFDVKADEVTFAGSWEKTAHKESFFGRDRFDFEARAAPGRAAVLKALVPAAKGTGWDALFCEELGAACTKSAPVTASRPTSTSHDGATLSIHRSSGAPSQGRLIYETPSAAVRAGR